MLTQVSFADGLAYYGELLSIMTGSTHQIPLPSKAFDHAAGLLPLSLLTAVLCTTCRWQQLKEPEKYEATCVRKVQGMQEGAAAASQ